MTFSASPNYIQGNPNVQVSNILTEYEISTLFNAKGNLSPNPHRGVDSATPTGTEFTAAIWNDNASVFDVTRDSDSVQGNNITTKTPLNYSYKGIGVQENLYTRYLHLNSIEVKSDQFISGNTVLGGTGNSGQWDGSTYSPHLHLDMYTNSQSPFMKYLNMQSGKNSMIKYDNKYYYDPFLFLNKNLYNIGEGAHLYNK